MGVWFLINYVILISIVVYFAYRLGHNVWIFGIISLLLSPVVGFLFLAIWDYYKNFLKGRL